MHVQHFDATRDSVTRTGKFGQGQMGTSCHFACWTPFITCIIACRARLVGIIFCIDVGNTSRGRKEQTSAAACAVCGKKKKQRDESEGKGGRQPRREKARGAKTEKTRIRVGRARAVC